MKPILLLIFALSIGKVFSQTSNTIFTSDIDNFWTAYDSIQKTKDLPKKLGFINQLYINKGTKGLKAFMKLRDYNDTLYIDLIEKYPKFWNSVRANTLTIKNKTKDFNKAVKTFQKIYPDLKDADLYFTIGGLRSGGTVKENMVLIGAEISTATSLTEVSEFKSNWLKSIFATQSLDHVVSMNIHEYVHTQQKSGNSNLLLHQVIMEGASDFITELVLKEPLQRKYITYGTAHSAELKKQFKEEMFLNSYTNWLYNGELKGEAADLGYYMGYEISKAYYQQSKNKKQAIKEIIELDYSDDQAVENFLKQSKFYKEGFDKKVLIAEYQKKSPYIVKIEPFENGSSTVDPTIKELRITFSKEMNPKKISIKYSEKGKDFFPLKKLLGFENNDTTFLLEMDLQPNKNYEFIIGNSFLSKDGYPLLGSNYTVHFKTK